MQSDVNPHKVCKITGYNIIYIMFFIVCNNIITIQKKEEDIFETRKGEYKHVRMKSYYSKILCHLISNNYMALPI